MAEEWQGLKNAEIKEAKPSLTEALRQAYRRMFHPESTPENEFATKPVHDYLKDEWSVPGAIAAGFIPSTKEELPGTVANYGLAGAGGMGKPFVNEAGEVVQNVHQWGSPASKWVMKTSNKPLSYLLSGKWLGTPKALGGNMRAAYAGGRTMEVPLHQMQSPPGWEAIKAALGQAVKK